MLELQTLCASTPIRSQGTINQYALQGVEVLRTLAAATPACMRALLQSNCVDTCLTVLDRADSNSNSNVARTAALLLHDALDWLSVCRCSNRERNIKKFYNKKVLVYFGRLFS